MDVTNRDFHNPKIEKRKIIYLFFSVCFLILSFVSPADCLDAMPGSSVLATAALEAEKRFGIGSTAGLVTSFQDLQGNFLIHLFLVTKSQGDPVPAGVNRTLEDLMSATEEPLWQEAYYGSLLIREMQGESILVAFHHGVPNYLTAARVAEERALAYAQGKPVMLRGVLYVSPLEYYFEYEREDERFLVNVFNAKILSRDELEINSVPAPAVSPPEKEGEYADSQKNFAASLTDDDGGTSAAVKYPEALFIAGVPDYNQRSSLPNSCGPTAAASLLGFWDFRANLDFMPGEKNDDAVTRLIEELSKGMNYDPQIGVYYYMVPAGLKQVIDNRGHKFDIGSLYAIDSLDIVRQEISADRPFIYGSQVNVWGTGHYVVVVGYEEEFIIVHDNWWSTPVDYYVNWHALGHADDMLVTIYPVGQEGPASEPLPADAAGGGGGCFIGAADFKSPPAVLPAVFWAAAGILYLHRRRASRLVQP